TQNLPQLATVVSDRSVARSIPPIPTKPIGAIGCERRSAMENGMASEASWQAGVGYEGSKSAPASGTEMDQGTVESLLRRLVERVEQSERRYGEALEELHARLDRLSATTGAARAGSSPEEAETLDRLHSQVSDLARRLEQTETRAPTFDEFAELGKALSE